MQTIVLRIPDSLAAELEEEARRCHLTKSEVVRRRLAAAGRQDGGTISGYELISDLVGSVEEGPEDFSEHRKLYLKKTNYGKTRRHR